MTATSAALLVPTGTAANAAAEPVAVAHLERLQTLASKPDPCAFIRDHPDDLVIKDPDGRVILKDLHNLVTHLSVDDPAEGEELAVGPDGKVILSGVVKKGMTFLDASVGTATATDPTLGKTGDLRILLNTWKISLRPAKLGTQDLCVRAQFLKKFRGHVFRPVTVVDRTAPGNVRGLSVSGLTDTSATVTWDAATDNYGISGYEVTVDGGTPHRVSSRRYRITGLDASSSHTVSVVAIDDAGNRSGTPATTSFTTKAPPPPPPPPPPPNSGPITVYPENGSATATWRPGASDATYAISLDGQAEETSPVDTWCYDDAGQHADPCTTNDTIRYPIQDLESDTPYSLKVDVTAAGGGAARTETADFRTTETPPVVPEATIQQIASESRQCTGAGGSFYLSPTRRAAVTVPAGARQLFPGCYKAADSSCVDEKLPTQEDGKLGCEDDVTDLVRKVAPPGQGPTLDGLAGTLSLAPAVACLESACTVAFVDAAETALLAPVAVGAGLSLSSIAAIAGAIIVAVVLAKALLTIWTGTPIAIPGLVEYPIDFDDDFATFDNWFGSNTTSEWYTSEKLYAQIVTTIRTYQPPAFDLSNEEDGDLKRIIDKACTAQKKVPQPSNAAGCDDGVAVYVPGGTNAYGVPMPETGKHITDTMAPTILGNNPERVPWFYPARSVKNAKANAAGFTTRWYDKAQWQPNTCTGRLAKGLPVCDEFPFRSTNQAGNLSGTLASLKPTPVGEDRAQGNDLAGFYNNCDVKDDEEFLIIPIAPWVAAGGPSFGLRLNNNNAVSVCQKPSGGR